MRNILIAFMLLAAIKSNAQDSIRIGRLQYGITKRIPIIYYDTSSIRYLFNMPDKPDTSECMMLITDTFTVANWRGDLPKSTTAIFHYDQPDRAVFRNGGDKVYWVVGYSVTNSNSIRCYYLDWDKKPLPKSMVVWLAQTVKLK